MTKAASVKQNSSSIDANVGENLRARRKELGLTQGSLAQEVGVSFQQIQKYEKGINRISASRMYILAKALDVEIDYFYQGVKAGALEKFHSIGSDAEKMLSLYNRIEDKKLKKALLDTLRSYMKSK